MLQTIYARNVNNAFVQGMEMLKTNGVLDSSRVGDVIVLPYPVTTTYERPIERVLFSEQRDANPFLHLLESLWMLAGHNDVAYLTKFTKTFKGFSDDGVTLNGAYGYRWRHHFGGDQLDWVINELRQNPNSRRATLQMWDAAVDPWVASQGSKDVPCNTNIYFRARPGNGLDMTVCCRSNDIIWGAYGANAVHMSMLHEYVARCCNMNIGVYYQVSNDFHAYVDLFEKYRIDDLAEEHKRHNPYGEASAVPLWLMINGAEKETWDMDLAMFMEEPTAVGFRNIFFRRVAVPMMAAHTAWKGGDIEAALEICEQMPDDLDWRLAAETFLHRRIKRRES